MRWFHVDSWSWLALSEFNRRPHLRTTQLKRKGLPGAMDVWLPTYRYRDKKAFLAALCRKAALAPQPKHSEPIYWNKTQPSKRDEDYQTTVVMQDLDMSPVKLAVLKQMFKDEFDLEQDIRWVGIVITNPTPGEPGTGGREDAMFLVHEADSTKLWNGHRLDLGFRWWFDVVAPGNTDSRIYPRQLRRTYSIDLRTARMPSCWY
ncbi:hypothetical protein WJX72_005890 [[Myrmecia] bisecta]|uniref:Uncharacterized protein n=1 Tax=[Myrmecia] bisecta TaxID=41462 RepID=A0AAW1PAK5_9CHLO